MNERELKTVSYSHGLGDIPLLGMTIGDVLERSARLYPTNDALVVRQQQIRCQYREFFPQVNQAAKGLMRLGVQEGDRVAIWATNRAEWVITQFATARIGAILVNINPAYGPYELEYALKQSEAQSLLLIRGFKHSDYVSMFLELSPEASKAGPGALRAQQFPHLKHLIFLGDEEKPPGMMSWKELLILGSEISDDQLAQRALTLDFDDPINIQYTSGTTGFPKGALLSHHNIVNNALLVGRAMGIGHHDKICIPVPFYHCFGMVLGNMVCAVSAATMVIPAESFDPLATLEAVHQERCSALYGVPTMFIAELEHPDFHKFDLGSLRTGIMAGSPCPIELMKRVVEQMHCNEITIAYGLTESSPVITQTRTSDPIEVRVTTVGRALPHTEVKIMDPETGKLVPRGTHGELCTRGYLVMKGYYNNPEATRAAIDVDGWLHSGDIATMDENGYCKITGRVKDMIIRGGENIYPREIEEFLYTHPAVCQVQVVGVPDRKYGEEVVAWVQLKEGMAATSEDIVCFCEGRIARYKIPKYIKFVDAYPMTVTGKVQKYKIRQMAIDELGLEGIAEIETA